MAAMQQLATARYNYNSRAATSGNAFWSGGGLRYPKELTFYNQLQQNQVQMPASLPENTKGDDHLLRGLRQAVGVEDNLFEISYPIAYPDDTCDCVTFPTDGYTVSSCDSMTYWGAFDVTFMDGSCYRLQFNEGVVYSECRSGETVDMEPYYVLCEVDFTQETSTGVSDTTSGISKAKTKEEETTAASVRQETTGGGAKTTHIHLSVHRLITFALEAVLALQAPWV